MTKSIRVIMSLSILMACSGHAAANCELPTTTPIIPDGNVASMDELVAAQQAMKKYQGVLGEFRTCLIERQEGLDPEAEDTAGEIAKIALKHDSSVEAEQKIADEFNVSVRAYKARQPAETE